MERIRVVIMFNGKWECTADGGCRYSGSQIKSKGLIVPMNIKYDELYQKLQSIIPYDSSKSIIELHSTNIGGGDIPYQMDVENDEDLEFVLSEKRYPPQICVTFVDRPDYKGVQQAGIGEIDDVSFNGSNQPQVGTQLAPPFHENNQAGEAQDAHRNEVQDADVHDFSNAERQCTRNDGIPFSESTRYGVQHGEGVVRQLKVMGNLCSNGSKQDTVQPLANTSTGWHIQGANAFRWQGDVTSVMPEANTKVIYKGQFFMNKKDIQRLLGLYALGRNFEWRVHRSSKSLFHAVCKDANCSWKFRAIRINERSFWEVRGWNDEHTCMRNEVHQCHRQASASIIGEVIASRLSGVEGRVIKPKDIIADMKEMYGIQILYSKAWQALHYALSLTYGSPTQSYQLLPSYCHALREANPGSHTDLSIDTDNHFLYFFMSFGPSIRGFQRYLRPIIAVDGTRLKGRYKGTMFVACAKDGNDQAYPLAFGYGDTENIEAWTWFFKALHMAIGNIDKLMFISDRNTGIAEGIRIIFPDAEHVLCCWNISENMMKQFHRTDLKDFFWAAARSYTLHEFDKHMDEIKRVNSRCYDMLMEIGPRKWSRVHCPLPRYQLMTTNIAKCLNSCLKFARSLSVTTLTEFIRNMTQMWHYDQKNIASSWTSQLASVPHARVMKMDADTHHMTCTAVECNVFLVRHHALQWMVDLQQRTCTCEFFQRERLPCAHALIAARGQNIDWTTLCANFYLSSAMVGAYSEPIMPVGGPTQWVIPEDVRAMVVLPPKMLPQAGKLHRSHSLSSSETRTRKKGKYCGSYSHPSSNCPNRAADTNQPSSSNNRARSPSHRRCGNCHQTGHYKQRCPMRVGLLDRQEADK